MKRLLRLGWAGLLAVFASPAYAQLAESPPSVTLGVAYQGSDLNLTGALTEHVTITMTSGLRPTPVLYAQAPITPWWRAADGTTEVGYSLRAGYRSFELTQQDLGDGDVQDYGTRIRGHAFYAMPYAVFRLQGATGQSTAGLGVGVGQFSASGEILVRRSLSVPPYGAIERVAVNANAWTRSIGAFWEFRMGALVAAMESAILLADKSGDQYEVSTYSFSLAWRIDF